MQLQTPYRMAHDFRPIPLQRYAKLFIFATQVAFLIG